jgi:hypothetical protein
MTPAAVVRFLANLGSGLVKRPVEGRNQEPVSSRSIRFVVYAPDSEASQFCVGYGSRARSGNHRTWGETR